MNPVVIGLRIVQRPAVEPQIARFCFAHRGQQVEARDISIAPRGGELDLRAERFLFGIEDIQDGAVAHAVFGADAFQAEARGIDCDLRGTDQRLRGLPLGISGPYIGDHRAFNRDFLFHRGVLAGLCGTALRGGQPALEQRDRRAHAGLCGGRYLGNAARNRTAERTQKVGVI